jgi:hypothetical protein
LRLAVANIELGPPADPIRVGGAQECQSRLDAGARRCRRNPHGLRVVSTEQGNTGVERKRAHPWARPLALTAAVVFCISAVFPVGAGLAQNSALFPRWWGPLDVVVASVLAALTLVIVALTEGRVGRDAQDASYRVYRALSHGILVLIVVFFLFGDRIVWINCLPGFAWRTWALIYGLPAWFTALRGSGAEDGDGISRPPSESA